MPGTRQPSFRYAQGGDEEQWLSTNFITQIYAVKKPSNAYSKFHFGSVRINNLRVNLFNSFRRF